MLPHLYEIPSPPRLRQAVAIYVLIHPIYGHPVYVGQANSPATRFNDHLRRWEEVHGYVPRMLVIEEVPESNADAREMHWITKLSEEGHPLVNQHAQSKPFSWRTGKFKYSIEQMHEIAKAKNGICLSTTFQGVRVHHRWKCQVGHEWSAQAMSVINGSWCPLCARVKGKKKT